MKKIFVLFLFSLLFINNTFSKDFWELVNVPNDTYVRDISFAANGNILSCNYGLFESTNSGNSWNDISILKYQSTTFQLSAMSIWFQSIYPINDTLIFACMGDGVPLKSINAGTTWELVNSELSNMHTFMKAGNGRIFANDAYNLFYTDDLGNTWNRYEPWEKSDVGTFSKVRMALSTSGELFASNHGVWVIDPLTLESVQSNEGLDSSYIRCFAFKNGKVYAGTNTSGIYISSDNGITWNNLTNSPKNVAISVLAVTQSGKLLAGSEDGGLYYSTDNGDNWTISNSGFAKLRIFDIEVKANTIYIGSNGIYTSTDDGDSWQSLPAKPGYPSIGWLDMDKNSNTYSLTQSNLYKSIDNFKSWNKIETELNFNKLYNILLSDDGKIFNILSDGGFQFSDDEGITFKKVSSEFDSSSIFRIAKNSLGNLFIQVQDKSYSDTLFVSKDYGANWLPLRDLKSCNFYNIGENDEILIWDYVNNSLIFSQDNGNTWLTKSCSLLENSSLPIRNVEMSGQNIFLGTYYEGIIKSSDGGDNWAITNSGLNSNIKYGNQIRVYNINEVLGTVYASTDIGLFSSNLADTTWTLQESGIIPSVSRITNYLMNKHIYTTTITGVYRSIDEITSVENESLVIDGINIIVQPNPINEKGTINISSDFPTNLKLNLYDVSGNIIKVLFDNSISSGNTDLSFHVSNFSSGQYYLRAETGNNSKTKIISIIK
jgi:photosystem II stability/assembly factor-like uncharacterized protein